MKAVDVLKSYTEKSINQVSASRDVKREEIMALQNKIKEDTIILDTFRYKYGIGSVVSKVIRGKECHILIDEHDGTCFKGGVIRPDGFLKGKKFNVQGQAIIITE